MARDLGASHNRWPRQLVRSQAADKELIEIRGISRGTFMIP
jgi:hypothetical protein